MKIKRTISIAIVCVLLVTVLSAVMVYAPPPPDIPSSPFQEVIIVNTDPIPAEVTNPAGESLNVQVANTVDVDVTDWLAMTEVVFEELPALGPYQSDGFYYSGIAGFDEVTIYINSADAVTAGLTVYVTFQIIDGSDLLSGYDDTFTLYDDEFSKTYEVTGNRLYIGFHNPNGLTTVYDLEFGYYATT